MPARGRLRLCARRCVTWARLSGCRPHWVGFLVARCDPPVTRSRMIEGHLRSRRSSPLESSDQRPQFSLYPVRPFRHSFVPGAATLRQSDRLVACFLSGYVIQFPRRRCGLMLAPLVACVPWWPARGTPGQDKLYMIFWVLTAVLPSNYVLVSNAVRCWSSGMLSIFLTIVRNRVLDFIIIATCYKITAPAMPQEGGELS